MASTFVFDRTPLAELISEFERTEDLLQLEVIADVLGASNDNRAITPLLRRLGCPLVERNADAEDAVCGALLRLGVMWCSSTGRYVFVPAHAMDRDTVETIRELDASIPMRYFLSAAPPR